MFRKWAAAFLLLPMSFSGQWMICGDNGFVVQESDAVAVEAENVPLECDGTMCPMMKRSAAPGPYCLLSSTDGAGIVVFDSGLATPAVTVAHALALPLQAESPSELVALYSHQFQSILTPPPRAETQLSRPEAFDDAACGLWSCARIDSMKCCSDSGSTCFQPVSEEWIR